MNERIICDHCHRGVPVAPGRFNVSVPHVRYAAPVGSHPECEPCTGNEKRTWLAVEHPARVLVLQHMIWDDDSMWDLGAS